MGWVGRVRRLWDFAWVPSWVDGVGSFDRIVVAPSGSVAAPLDSVVAPLDSADSPPVPADSPFHIPAEPSHTAEPHRPPARPPLHTLPARSGSHKSTGRTPPSNSRPTLLRKVFPAPASPAAPSPNPPKSSRSRRRREEPRRAPRRASSPRRECRWWATPSLLPSHNTSRVSSQAPPYTSLEECTADPNHCGSAEATFLERISSCQKSSNRTLSGCRSVQLDCC